MQITFDTQLKTAQTRLYDTCQYHLLVLPFLQVRRNSRNRYNPVGFCQRGIKS